MNTMMVWLLVASAGASHTTPAVLGTFADEKECLASASRLEYLSRDKKNMAYLYGVCVRANIIRPEK